MKIKTTLAIMISAAALSLAACGSTAEELKGPNSEARTTAFKSMMPNFSTMGKMVKGEETYDAEKFKTAAAEFSVESKEPFKHFERDAVDPKGAHQDGDALPAVWEKPEEARATAEKFHAAVENLNAKAQAGNLEEIKVAYGEVGASCKACHDTFRKPK